MNKDTCLRGSGQASLPSLTKPLLRLFLEGLAGSGVGGRRGEARGQRGGGATQMTGRKNQRNEKKNEQDGMEVRGRAQGGGREVGRKVKARISHSAFVDHS